MAQTDRELMACVQARGHQAFEALRARHEATLRLHLLRYVGPEDAQDLGQEALVRLWDRAEQWNGSGAPLAWLLRIATNLALNHLRDEQRRAALSLSQREHEEAEDEAPTLEPAVASAEELAQWREQASRLLDLVTELPPDKQDVLRMARLQGMALKDIASDLGVPVGTVKSRLHSATRWLTERWEEGE